MGGCSYDTKPSPDNSDNNDFHEISDANEEPSSSTQAPPGESFEEQIGSPSDLTPTPFIQKESDNDNDITVIPPTDSSNSSGDSDSMPAMSDELQVATDLTKSQVTLLAVGDNLIHTEVILSGKKKDGTYNYDHIYANLKKDISAADIAVINQETILGGKEFKYSGYPNFNSPAEIGEAVINAGFDVVLQATNHTLDKGSIGVENNFAFWKLHPEITVLGINETKEKRDEIPIIEKNGIKIAMLNYTYGLNGHPIPKDRPYLVNKLDKNAMKKDIERAKDLADFVIVFPHWGIEYVYEANSAQKDLTEFFYELGVDLIIGTHPHVLEPVEWIETDGEHRMLVYYSLGNFVSYQREAPRMLGGIANITLTKDKNGTYISDAGITPVVTHYENGPSDYNYGIYKLTDYTENLALVHGVSELGKQGPLTYQGTFDLASQILGSWFTASADKYTNPYLIINKINHSDASLPIDYK
jgi:poly-gamma-glutamate synthesis protein (capsule biosynthesis protein)